MQEGTIKVVTFAEEPILAVGLRKILNEAGDIEQVKQTDQSAVLALDCERFRPDVVIVSLTHFAPNLIRDLRRASPSTGIILFLPSIQVESVHHAMEEGVRGVILRCFDESLILECVRQVAGGHLWFDRVLEKEMLGGRSIRLTRREAQMIASAAQGLKNKEIAHSLGISEGTVKVYMSKLLAKVGAKDRLELALYGLRNFPAESAIGAEPSVQSFFRTGEIVERRQPANEDRPHWNVVRTRR